MRAAHFDFRHLAFQDRGDLLLDFALPAVQFLEQLVGELAAFFAIFPEQPPADGQQDVAKINVDDVGFFADAEIDRPIFPLDFRIAQQVQQLRRFAAASVAGKEELGRSIEWSQQGIGQFGDRIAGAVDVEWIRFAVLPGLERQIQLEVQPGPVKIICDDVVKTIHCFLCRCA